jgi:tetratricopeptide (TPR) repeat protein
MIRILAALLLGGSLFLAEEGEWDQTRRIAEAQHEVVLLLIREKAFDKVMDGCKKIFSLSFPKDREHLLVKSVTVFADSLVRQEQLGLARKVLDGALRVVRYKPSKASLYKEKGYISKVEGKDQEALDFFEEAIKLEQAAPSPAKDAGASGEK